MFERLTAFLKKTNGEGEAERPDDNAVSCVALALAVMRADGIVADSESRALERLIRDQFGLDHAGFVSLLAVASAEQQSSNDQYRHAAHLRRHLDEAHRIEFVSILWSLVEADGNHGEMEDHLVWRIAEMLEVSGHDARRLSEHRSLQT